jgi:hypothetical protein
MLPFSLSGVDSKGSATNSFRHFTQIKLAAFSGGFARRFAHKRLWAHDQYDLASRLLRKLFLR